MKKQFNRMKQLANQTVGRARKCLCIERRLDTVRSVCHNSHKRLVTCFQGQHGTEADKRHVSASLSACT
uniref:BAR domain-containing protein n=1 Tax=Sphenodon punctatus TaxID=8508 RepID=A0A8D0H4J9_SPHPU